VATRRLLPVDAVTRVEIRNSVPGSRLVAGADFELRMARPGRAVRRLLQALLARRRDKRRAVNFAPQAKRHMGPKLFAEASPVM
jgi:hypothetical protein